MQLMALTLRIGIAKAAASRWPNHKGRFLPGKSRPKAYSTIACLGYLESAGHAAEYNKDLR